MAITDPVADVTWHSCFWAEGTEFAGQGYADGDGIGTWPDEASTHDATQATAAERPVLFDPAFNGKPAVYFDDRRGWSLSTATFSAVSQPFSIFAVVMVDTGSSRRIFTATKPDQLLTTNSSGKFVANAGSGLNSNVDADWLVHTLTAKYNGGSSLIRVDGSETTGNAGSATPTKWVIGWDGVDPNYLSGFVAFVGVKAGAFTSGEITDLEGWAASHYGLTTNRRTDYAAAWSYISNPRAVAIDSHTYVAVPGGEGAVVLDYDGAAMAGSFAFTSVNGQDSHNSGGLIVKATEKPLVFYTGHNADRLLRYRIGSQAIESGMAWGSEQTIDVGGLISFAEAVEHDGDVYVFYRRGNSTWGFVKSTDWGSNWSSPTVLFDYGEQGYLVTTLVGDTIRCGFGSNPGATDQKIYYCEIDLTSGDVDKIDGTNLGNLDGTSLPVTVSSCDTVASPTSGYKTRIYDVADGTDREVVWGEYDSTDISGTSEYEYSVYDGGWSTEPIVAAGDVWSDSSEDYLGECRFPVGTGGGEVVVARENSGTWYLQTYTTANGGSSWSSSVLAPSSDVPYARPHPVVDADGTSSFVWGVTRIYSFDDTDDVIGRIEMVTPPEPPPPPTPGGNRMGGDRAIRKPPR